MEATPLLVVDDDPANLALMRTILRDQYRLIFARNGEEAIALARKHRPALILLDIQMPDMDGYAVCQRLKIDPALADTPVIFVTALGEVGNEATGFAMGAVDYLVKPVSPEIVRSRVRAHLSLVRGTRLEKSYHDAIFMLGEAGHYRDNDTGAHIWRMAAYAKALASAGGWKDEGAKLIELAAPMHDTGKLGVPDAILLKPAKLDADEWVVMKTHSQIGHDILAKSDAPIFTLAAEIALRHHERWDGSGYPGGLSGESIPESARIVALADVFDALTMKRPYKEAWPIERVTATLLESAGSHFDPRLTEIFLSIMPKILEIRARWDSMEQIP